MFISFEIGHSQENNILPFVKFPLINIPRYSVIEEVELYITAAEDSTSNPFCIFDVEVDETINQNSPTSNEELDAIVTLGSIEFPGCTDAWVKDTTYSLLSNSETNPELKNMIQTLVDYETWTVPSSITLLFRDGANPEDENASKLFYLSINSINIDDMESFQYSKFLPKIRIKWSYTPYVPEGKQLILNFDGEDGSTDLLEEVHGYTQSEWHNYEIDTSWYKFGSGSLLMGVDPLDHSNIEYDTPTRPSGNKLTMHAFFKIGEYPNDGDHIYLACSETGGRFLDFGIENADGQTRAYVGSSEVVIGERDYLDPEDLPLLDTEYHIALVVDDYVVRLFIGGQKIKEYTTDAILNEMNAYWAYTDIGFYHVDAFEIQYEAMWTNNFTPPDSPPSP